MGKPKVDLALPFVVAIVLSLGPRQGLADSSCSTLDASVTFSSTLSLPSASSAPFVAIRAAIAQGHYDVAADLLRKAPRGAEQSLWTGMLLLRLGKTFASIRSLEEAAHFHDNSTIETLLAVDYLLLNQRQLTVQSIQKSLALEPGNKLALYLQGRYDFVTHNYAHAIEDFHVVLKSEPDDYRSLYYLGYSEWRLGDTGTASRDLRRSVDIIQCKQIDFILAPFRPLPNLNSRSTILRRRWPTQIGRFERHLRATTRKTRSRVLRMFFCCAERFTPPSEGSRRRSKTGAKP